MLCRPCISGREPDGKGEKHLSLFVSLVANICYKNRQQKGVEEATLSGFCYPDAFLIPRTGVCAATFKATQMVSEFRWWEPWLWALFFFNVKHFSSKKIFCFCRLKHGDINTESEGFLCVFFFKVKCQVQHRQPQSNFLVVPMSTLELGKTTLVWEMIHHSDSPVRTSPEKKLFWFKVMEKSLIIN